jgi:hypothetical protein
MPYQQQNTIRGCGPSIQIICSAIQATREGCAARPQRQPEWKPDRCDIDLKRSRKKIIFSRVGSKKESTSF